MGGEWRREDSENSNLDSCIADMFSHKQADGKLAAVLLRDKCTVCHNMLQWLLLLLALLPPTCTYCISNSNLEHFVVTSGFCCLEVCVRHVSVSDSNESRIKTPMSRCSCHTKGMMKVSFIRGLSTDSCSVSS